MQGILSPGFNWPQYLGAQSNDLGLFQNLSPWVLAQNSLAPRQSGVSAQTQRQMASDPDLDKGLYQPVQPLVTQPLGNDPTQRIPQSLYDQRLQQQLLRQDQNYQRWIQRGKK